MADDDDGDDVTISYKSSINDISTLYQRVRGVITEMYEDEIMQPTFNGDGDAVMHRAPRFDLGKIGLSVFPPSSGCEGSNSARGSFPVVAARKMRASVETQVTHPENALKFSTILHPLYSIGHKNDCALGAVHLDHASNAMRRSSLSTTELESGKYVFTGVVIKATGTATSELRDPFCQVNSDQEFDSSDFIETLVARDASVPPRAFGVTDLQDGSCAGGGAVGKTSSTVGEYIQCTGSTAALVTEGKPMVTLHTGLGIELANTQTKIEFTTWPAAPGTPTPAVSVIYVYAPLRQEFQIGDSSSCIDITAPQSATLQEIHFNKSPPWKSTDTLLYRGWGSRPREDVKPLQRVIGDMRAIVLKASRQRGDITADDLSYHKAIQSEGAPLVPLLRPMLTSTYMPYIKRDKNKRRLPMVDSPAAQSIEDNEGDFIDILSFSADALQYDASNENFYGCDGLMATSHLCDCARMRSLVGSTADANRGYRNFFRAMYAINGREKISSDALQCYAAACNGGDPNRPVMTAFGRPQCAQLISECDNYDADRGNQATGGTDIQEKISMNCGIGTMTGNGRS